MNVSTTPRKLVKLTIFNRFLDQFDPFNFIFNMGIGISSNLLYVFPYSARLLKIYSYRMFAINVILFISQQFVFVFFFLHLFYFSKKNTLEDDILINILEIYLIMSFEVLTQWNWTPLLIIYSS